MYLLTATNPETERSARLLLPMKSSELDEKLSAIGYDNIDKPLELSEFLNDGYDMPQLPSSVIRAGSVFEVNYLAQRLSLLSVREKEMFQAATDAYELRETRSLINTAIEVAEDAYEVAEDVGDFEELGRYYVENEYSALDDCITDNLDYEGVGIDVDLLEYSHGKFFDKGYIHKPGDADELLYDGHILPDFDYDKDYLAKIRYVLGNGDEMSTGSRSNGR